MKMEIVQLRELFESRFTDIQRVLNESPPRELPDVEVSLRALKGFLFNLEGVLRKDELRGLPFTARNSINSRVQETIDRLQGLPATPSPAQVLPIIQGVDTLYGLCLQYGVMAAALDANKLGQVALILQRKLNDVLRDIDKVGEQARANSETLVQAGQKGLAEVQSACQEQLQAVAQAAGEATQTLAKTADKATQTVTRTAGEATQAVAQTADKAAESIDSRARSLAQRQEEALRNLAQLMASLEERHKASLVALSQRVESAQAVLADILQRKDATQQAADQVRQQLQAAEEIRESLVDTKATAEKTTADLAERLGKADQGLDDLKALLEAGGQTEGRGREVLAAATQSAAQAREMEQEISKRAQAIVRRHDKALADADTAIAHLEEKRKEHEAAMEAELGSAHGVLTDMQARRQESQVLVDQTAGQFQAAKEVSASVAATGQAVEEAAGRVRQRLADAQGLVDELRSLLGAGTDLHSKAEARLEFTTAASARIEEIERTIVSLSGAFSQRHKEALAAVDAALAAIDQTRKDTAAALTEQVGQARAAVSNIHAGREDCQAMVAQTGEQLQAARRTVEAVEATRKGVDADAAQVQTRLKAAQKTAEELRGLLSAGSEVQTQAKARLDAATGASARAEELERDLRTLSAEYNQRHKEALDTLGAAVTAIEQTRKDAAASLAEHNLSAETIVSEMRTRQEQSQATAAQTAEQLRSAVAQTTEQLQTAVARTSEQLESAATQAAGQLEAARTAAQTAAATRAGVEADAIQVEARLQAVQKIAEELRGILSASTVVQAQATARLDVAAGATARVEELERSIRAVAAEFGQRHKDALSAIDAALAAIEQTRKDTAAALAQQVQTGGSVVAEIQQKRDDSQAIAHQAQDRLDAAAQAAQAVEATRVAAGEAAAQTLSRLQAAQKTVEELRDLLSAGTEIQAQAKARLDAAIGASARAEELERALRALSGEFGKRHAEALSAIDAALAAIEQTRKDAAASLDRHDQAAGEVVADIRTKREESQATATQAAGQLEAARQAAQAVEATRLAADQASAQILARLQAAEQTADELRELLSAGTEVQAQAKARLDVAIGASTRAEELERSLRALSSEFGQRHAAALSAIDAALAAIEQTRKDAAASLADRVQAADGIVAGMHQKQEESQAAAAQATGQLQASVAQASQQLQTSVAQASQQLDAARQASQAVAATRLAADQSAAQTQASLQAAQRTAEEMRNLLSAAAEVQTQAQGRLEIANGASVRAEELERALRALSAEFGQRHKDGLSGIDAALAAIEQTRKDTAASLAQQVQAAGGIVADIQRKKDEAQATAAQSTQQLQATVVHASDQLHAAVAQASGQIQTALAQAAEQVQTARRSAEAAEATRAAADDAAGGVQARLEKAQRSVVELGELLETGMALQSKAQARLDVATSAAAHAGELERNIGLLSGAFGQRHKDALAALDAALAGIDQTRAKAAADLAEQVRAAARAAADTQAGKLAVDELLARAVERAQAVEQNRAAVADLRAGLEAETHALRAGLAEAKHLEDEVRQSLAAGEGLDLQIQSRLDEVTASALRVQQTEDRVAEFCGQIDRHAEDMAAARSQVEAVVGELRRQADESLAVCARRTEELIAQNEQLQHKVRALLGDATEAGLSGQFDSRLAQVERARRQWGRWLLGAALGATCLLGVLLPVLLLSARWELALVLVGGICFPLAFAMYFCTAQYNRERRLEEEYGYRATVSRILAPCRELLAEMPQEDTPRWQIMERLMREVFASPIPRVFSGVGRAKERFAAIPATLEQPAAGGAGEAAAGQASGVVAGAGEPAAEVAAGRAGEAATETASAEQPAGAPAGGLPTDTPTTEQPAQLPAAEQPAKAPAVEPPAQTPAAEQPVQVPAMEQTVETLVAEQPAVSAEPAEAAGQFVAGAGESPVPATSSARASQEAAATSATNAPEAETVATNAVAPETDQLAAASALDQSAAARTIEAPANGEANSADQAEGSDDEADEPDTADLVDGTADTDTRPPQPTGQAPGSRPPQSRSARRARHGRRR